MKTIEPKKSVYQKISEVGEPMWRWNEGLKKLLERVIDTSLEDFLEGKLITPWKHSKELSKKKK